MFALQNAVFCEESFGNSHADAHVIRGRPTRQDVERFRNGSVPEFYSLQAGQIRKSSSYLSSNYENTDRAVTTDLTKDCGTVKTLHVCIHMNRTSMVRQTTCKLIARILNEANSILLCSTLAKYNNWILRYEARVNSLRVSIWFFSEIS